MQDTTTTSTIPEPHWLQQFRAQPGGLEALWGSRLTVEEWQEDPQDHVTKSTTAYRNDHGWKGRDLMHDRYSAVRITEYYVQYGPGMTLDNKTAAGGGVGTTLTGLVHFTARAESHAGYCHGGSMCAVLDDVIGWCGFCTTGNCLPWSGFTVQINTQLQKPIPLHSILVIQATIVKVERRKVYMEAKLMDYQKITNEEEEDAEMTSNDGATTTPASILKQYQEIRHASGDGMVVLNKGILPELATRGSLHSWPSNVEIT
mmetsp:Transcript_11344/g.23255  ORF Transcript_11344/g.23255 Transcript_11344/m.23255 type:complete len:259 (-) Transcript_11344:1714-2490(-)